MADGNTPQGGDKKPTAQVSSDNRFLFNRPIESGMGKGSKTPEETQNKFNWGAFGLTPLWAIAHKTPIGLLWLIVPLVLMLGNINAWLLIPGVALSLAISGYLGKNGNEWGWQNTKWISVMDFNIAQKAWARMGIAWLVIVILCSSWVILGKQGITAKFIEEQNLNQDKVTCANQLNRAGKIVYKAQSSASGVTTSMSSAKELQRVFTKFGGEKTYTKSGDDAIITNNGVKYTFVVTGQCDINRKTCGAILSRDAIGICKENNISLCTQNRTFCRMYIGANEVKEIPTPKPRVKEGSRIF